MGGTGGHGVSGGGAGGHEVSLDRAERQIIVWEGQEERRKGCVKVLGGGELVVGGGRMGSKGEGKQVSYFYCIYVHAHTHTNTGYCTPQWWVGDCCYTVVCGVYPHGEHQLLRVGLLPSTSLIIM